jgi:hypothetical protein
MSADLVSISLCVDKVTIPWRALPGRPPSCADRWQLVPKLREVGQETLSEECKIRVLGRERQSRLSGVCSLVSVRRSRAAGDHVTGSSVNVLMPPPSTMDMSACTLSPHNIPADNVRERRPHV